MTTGAVDAQKRGDLAARWSGGRSPWDLSWGKLMMWLFLICSSTTMALAVYAARQGARRQAVWFLAATIAAGCLFAGMQAMEWSHFIGEGARLTGNPWGVP